MIMSNGTSNRHDTWEVWFWKLKLFSRSRCLVFFPYVIIISLVFVFVKFVVISLVVFVNWIVIYLFWLLFVYCYCFLLRKFSVKMSSERKRYCVFGCAQLGKCIIKYKMGINRSLVIAKVATDPSILCHKRTKLYVTAYNKITLVELAASGSG